MGGGKCLISSAVNSPPRERASDRRGPKGRHLLSIDHVFSAMTCSLPHVDRSLTKHCELSWGMQIVRILSAARLQCPQNWRNRTFAARHTAYAIAHGVTSPSTSALRTRHQRRSHPSSFLLATKNGERLWTSVLVFHVSFIVSEMGNGCYILFSILIKVKTEKLNGNIYGKSDSFCRSLFSIVTVFIFFRWLKNEK